MKFLNNKPAAIIAAMGLLLGVSMFKIYQQRLQLRELRQESCHHQHHHHHHDCGEGIIHVEIPDIEIPNIEIPDIHTEELQEELSRQQELFEAEMERLQEEFERMERQEHFEVQKRRRRVE